MTTSRDLHTVQRYDEELNELRTLVIAMGEAVLSQFRSALTALCNRDPNLAQQVVDRDEEIDRYQLNADRTISMLLALRAPVASDLRLVMAASKSAAELELIGDEAVKIASMARFGDAVHATHPLDGEVRRMGSLALESLENGVSLLNDQNELKAQKVMANHRDLDQAFETILGQLMAMSSSSSTEVSTAVRLVLAVKALERVGHHTQSLTEYVMLQVKNDFSRAGDR